MSSPAGNTVGPTHVSDASNPDFRLGKDRQLIVDGLHGSQYESASRGNMFSATQATAGVAPGTAFSTTPPLQVWNPPNSGVNLIIREVGVAFRSGTLGQGVIGYGINASQATAPSTGTALVSRQLNGSAGTNSLGQANTGSTISAAANIVKLGFSTNANIVTAPAAAIGVSTNPTKDMIEGGIMVPQGAVFTVESYLAAAGSSPLTIMSVCWEEVSAA